MTNLVIGGSGFIGRRLIARLLQTGERVVATSRSVAGRREAPGLAWHTLDIASFDTWPDLLDGVSAVYHLAWSSNPARANADPVHDFAQNVVGSLRLLEALKSRATRLVFASSGGAVYGRLTSVPVAEDGPTRPIGAHGISKLTLENYIRMFVDTADLDATILRIGNAYGPDQSHDAGFGVVANYSRRAAAGEPVVIFGDGSTVRDYVYVDDVVEALHLAGTARPSRRTFNIGSGEGRSLIDVVRTIEQVLGREVPVRYEPARGFDVPISVLDVRRAQRDLGWRARMPFAQGVARTLAALGCEIRR
jgi:UDP-glucose 4-epimerase